MNRVEIKRRAKEFGFNNKWNFWKAILIVCVITSVASFIMGFITGFVKDSKLVASIISLVFSFAVIPLSIGLVAYFIDLVRGKNPDVITSLFSKYKEGYMWKIIIVSFIASLIIFGWSLLLVIPGIICAFKFAMTNYILAEQTPEELENGEAAYKISTRMMDGYKLDYFVFHLSFIGWFLLGSLTFGIAYIWIMPYYTTACVMYYEELKKISK